MTPKQPSPLGRYDDSPDDQPTHEVRLLNVPVRVLAAGRQQHDELMQGFAVLAGPPDGRAAGGQQHDELMHEFAVLAVALEDRSSVPARMLELIDTLGTRYGRAADRPDSAADEATARGAARGPLHDE